MGYTKNDMVRDPRLLPMPVATLLHPRQARAAHHRMQAREHFEALQGARKHQKTEAFRERLPLLLKSRAPTPRPSAAAACVGHYIGLSKTHLQHVLTTAAINLVRATEWYTGTPVAKTRCSRFAALQAAA